MLTGLQQASLHSPLHVCTRVQTHNHSDSFFLSHAHTQLVSLSLSWGQDLQVSPGDEEGAQHADGPASGQLAQPTVHAQLRVCHAHVLRGSSLSSRLSEHGPTELM